MKIAWLAHRREGVYLFLMHPCQARSTATVCRWLQDMARSRNPCLPSSVLSRRPPRCQTNPSSATQPFAICTSLLTVSEGWIMYWQDHHLQVEQTNRLRSQSGRSTSQEYNGLDSRYQLVLGRDFRIVLSSTRTMRMARIVRTSCPRACMSCCRKKRHERAMTKITRLRHSSRRKGGQYPVKRLHLKAKLAVQCRQALLVTITCSFEDRQTETD